MAKRNGGIIGPANTPTSSVAAGVWRLRDAFNYKKNGTWPSPFNLGSSSARFNYGSSDYLERTSTSGNRRTFTFSTWIKRGGLTSNNAGGYDTFFSSDQATTNSFRVTFNDDDGSADDRLMVYFYTGSFQLKLITSQVFRDMSAWYHIVVAVDTTQATSTDRVKIYVNGTQVTTFLSATYPSLNLDTSVNQSGAPCRVGAGTSLYFNGYMSDIFLIDGQQLTPSSFGETDTDTGIWKPKAYTGTYSTNGFYLKFANSASLGTDSSGNGNTFTVNNLTSIDQTTDTPTNNFATLNPLNMGTRITLTEGNLQQVTSASTSTSCRVASTIAVSAGKWYCEYKAVSGTTHDVGIYSTSESVSNDYIGSTAKSYGYYTTGTKYNNGGSAYGASWTAGDIIGIAFDADNGTLTFYKNGTSQGTAFTSIPNDFYYFAQGDSTNATWTGQFNFGNPPYSANAYTDGAGYGNFSYAVPSGYYSLNTKNLANFG